MAAIATEPAPRVLVRPGRERARRAARRLRSSRSATPGAWRPVAARPVGRPCAGPGLRAARRPRDRIDTRCCGRRRGEPPEPRPERDAELPIRSASPAPPSPSTCRHACRRPRRPRRPRAVRRSSRARPANRARSRNRPRPPSRPRPTRPRPRGRRGRRERPRRPNRRRPTRPKGPTIDGGGGGGGGSGEDDSSGPRRRRKGDAGERVAAR